MTISISSLLKETSHRPWPLPRGPWVMYQTWHDLLFAHWPVPIQSLKGILPPQLEIDTFDGEAWIGVIPFWMSGVRPRGIPALGRLSTFLESNVRTYVTHRGKHGVWFFSLDASSEIAVKLARTWYHLPYFFAEMSMQLQGRSIDYASKRIDRGLGIAAELQACYRAIAPVAKSKPGSLENWLTERYCLYTTGTRGELLRVEIHHMPWWLQIAETEFKANTMTSPLGIKLADTAPLLHFSKRLEVLIWNIQRT